MSSQITIHTARLTLKSITPLIINNMFREKTEAEIRAYFDIDESGFKHLSDMHQHGMETNRLSLFYFLLYEKSTDKIVGECGFHTWNRTHRRCELFYSLRDDIHKQKGYMTEAVAAVLEYGFNQLDLHRIAALVSRENIPSLRILQRFGFTKEGTMREDYVVNGVNEDSECYSLLKWEWQE